MEINSQNMQFNQEFILKGQNESPKNTSGAINTENQNSEEFNIDNISIISNAQNLDFKGQMSALMNNEIYNFSFSDDDFAKTFEFDTAKIDEDDAKFFLNVLEYNKITNFSQNIGEINQINDISASNSPINETKNVKATEKIMQILETTVKENKPVRIDFDNQITVILKVEQNGKLNAQFIPSDKIAEEYLKNNIQSLRNTFDEKNILYSYLDYRQNRGHNNSKERRDKR